MFAMTLLAAVTAATTATPAVSKKGDQVMTGDPNRVICRSEEMIGSRLRRQKRCMTAQEWADIYFDSRRTVERVQGGGWKSN
jgi:hypothetical protein